MKALKGLLAASLALAMCTVASAHQPPGATYPVYQFPSGVLPTIDGDLSEWDVVPEEYFLTLTDDFEETVQGIGTDFDLDDLDLRTCLAWSKETNRIYNMAHIVDDNLHNSREEYWRFNYDDEWHFVVDADHSGGELWGGEWEDRFDPQHYSTGQLYSLIVPPMEGYYNWMYHEGWWLTQSGKGTCCPDLYEAGWKRIGETGGPGEYGLEQKVSPWLLLSRDVPEESTMITLEEGMIIHAGFLWKDYDVAGQELYEGSYDFPPIHNIWRNAELLADFELMPVEGGTADLLMSATAVESASWGEIKRGIR